MPTKETIRTTERDKRITRRYALKLNVNTNAEIIEVLERQPSAQGFIKEALRFYIASLPTSENHFEKENEHENETL